MVINNINDILDFANSNLVSGLANISQFYNVYQSTKAGTYAQLNNDLASQTSEIENALEEQTQFILKQVIDEVKGTAEQNKVIIEQNQEIIDLLKHKGGI
jgi:hypothetical protein